MSCSAWFRLTQAFLLIISKSDRFEIGSQFNTAALSISGNIAEGFGRKHKNDKVKFYLYSRGSSCELRSHLLCAIHSGIGPQANAEEIIEICLQIEKELNSLINALNKNY